MLKEKNGKRFTENISVNHFPKPKHASLDPFTSLSALTLFSLLSLPHSLLSALCTFSPSPATPPATPSHPRATPCLRLIVAQFSLSARFLSLPTRAQPAEPAELARATPSHRSPSHRRTAKAHPPLPAPSLSHGKPPPVSILTDRIRSDLIRSRSDRTRSDLIRSRSDRIRSDLN
uniref:Uncharacterized protein n=1 Tax=Fagus sylvatica TaxID=28930 RepID=A0A2N9GSR0_FAGSY